MLLGRFIPYSLRQKKKLAKLRKLGVHIGNNVSIVSSISAFGTEPYLISIGNDVLISCNVTFLTHDGSTFVINNLYGTKFDKIKPIVIGDNVFIGCGVTILPGVHVGNNCIIGACSVVTKDIPNNSVVVGIPGRVIGSPKEFFDKNKNALDETIGWSYENKKHFYLDKFNKINR
jgi:acetyltransferase-like isoleucine patch superfamily enzyme